MTNTQHEQQYPKLEITCKIAKALASLIAATSLIFPQALAALEFLKHT